MELMTLVDAVLMQERASRKEQCSISPSKIPHSGPRTDPSGAPPTKTTTPSTSAAKNLSTDHITCTSSSTPSSKTNTTVERRTGGTKGHKQRKSPAQSSSRSVSKTTACRSAQVAYRISNARYGALGATVRGSYVTTKRKWHVAQVVDRRVTDCGVEYRVFWLGRRRTQRRYYKKTWEPFFPLLEDGFDQELNLVDRWKYSSVTDFARFCKDDPYGRHTVGADLKGLCLFEALKQAAQLVGRPDICSTVDIEEFVADELRNGVNLSHGTSWKQFASFLRRLRNDNRDFLFNEFCKNNFAIAGRRGARVMNEVQLYDGFFIVAAYNDRFVGHAFVLQVAGKRRIVYDGGRRKTVLSMKWINFYAFIRPFKVFEKKESK